MRLDIEGKHRTLAPHLMGWIAERLEDLNTPYDDICEARVIFVQQGRRDAVCVELLLAEQSLHVTQAWRYAGCCRGCGIPGGPAGVA